MMWDSIAIANLKKLANNPYPGRGLIIGMNQARTHAVLTSWIMGRSANSRNRVYTHDADRIFTEAADARMVLDPSLIMYNAMREVGGHFVVSNGDQTDTIIHEMKFGRTFKSAMEQREYEPDAPNYTPRISGMYTWSRQPCAQIAILSRSENGECQRDLYSYKSLPLGLGFCVTTYAGDGDPLPAFVGEPYLLPLHGTYPEIADTLWGALNEDNRVSLAAKFIPLAGGTSKVILRNKYQKV